ncbi:hypothetical protein F2P81_016676 [Scophthalmus maximus]|uniref:Uncharacterized protein n=1 Tax=Scophthalmus maximus TaxID=52904 RepID=A0A6A4SLU9_SCOMX|nr:hypothetical protein F2P81_016676 [Scophthalmus maximus]
MKKAVVKKTTGAFPYVVVWTTRSAFMRTGASDDVLRNPLCGYLKFCNLERRLAMFVVVYLAYVVPFHWLSVIHFKMPLLTCHSTRRKLEEVGYGSCRRKIKGDGKPSRVVTAGYSDRQRCAQLLSV